MRVLVIGSTGLTGRLCVSKLLAAGHDVTAMARRREDWQPAPAGLKVAISEVHQVASLEQAVQGQEAVIIAFGPRTMGKTDVQEVLMRNLVPLLQKHRIQRVINLSAWGVLESRKQSNWLLKLLMAVYLRHIFADKERGEVLLLRSGLNYVNVRPGQLTNGKPRGAVRAALDGKGIKPVVTRDDLATFMIAQLTDDTWLNQSPLLGS